MDIKPFIKDNFRHFNAASLLEAAQAYAEYTEAGNKMFLAMAGAMSTAEIGVSLGRMIRGDKIHAISCTGANLEEDIFNLIAHKNYKRVPGYRSLTAGEELKLRDSGFNRVTDTCIPEGDAIRKLQAKLYPLWAQAAGDGERRFPFEYIYQLIRRGELRDYYQIDPEESWVVAACEKDIPIFTPGWEDSTLANGLVAAIRSGRFKGAEFIKSGLEQMDGLISWYLDNTKEKSAGFFQIGGGIAGDFAICVVPLIRQDLKLDCRLWGYFCQISDSTTSYGSYSGAVPNEKITWEKLGVDTPKFIIESDASIVTPLIFEYVLSR